MELRVSKKTAYITLSVLIVIFLLACRQLPPEAKKVEEVQNATPEPVPEPVPEEETAEPIPEEQPDEETAADVLKKIQENATTTTSSPTVVRKANVTQFTQRGTTTKRWAGIGCKEADDCPKNYSQTYRIKTPDWMQSDAPDND